MYVCLQMVCTYTDSGLCTMYCLQAFCKAFHQVHGMVISDTRELEKDMQMKENEKIRLLHENAAGLEKMYQVALATPTIANTASKPHNPVSAILCSGV